MATKAQLWTQLSEAIKILDETYKFGATAGTNLATLLTNLQTDFAGNHISATQAAMTTYRASVSSLLTSTAICSALIQELARVGYFGSGSSVSVALSEIFEGMQDLTETVKNRAMTFGAISAGGGNIGTGILYRGTKDRYGHDLEGGQYVQGGLAGMIVGDRFTGKTTGNELLRLYGVGQTKVDELSLGTVSSGILDITSKISGSGLLGNATFDSYTGSGASLAFSSWGLYDSGGVSTPANFAAVTSDYFRKTVGASAGVSIRMTTNGYIEQLISSQSLDLSRPAFLIVRYKRESSCDGTLTLRLGTQTESVVLSGSGWTTFTLGTGTSIKGWYENFKEDNSGLGIRVRVDLSGNTTGDLLVDEIILMQPDLWNGVYYLLASGQTDFLKDDIFTWTDAVSNTGVMQTWFARLFGKYLPHTLGSPTYADA